MDSVCSSTPIVIRNVRIWDGVSDDYIADADALRIEGARIADVGDAKEISSGASVRDGGGLVVLPGLIDGHVHLSIDPEIRSPTDQPTGEPVRLAMIKRAGAMVRAGITTARDLGGGEWIELEVRDQISSGHYHGPRLICAGQPITSPGGHCHFWGGEAADIEAVISVLERQVKHGVDLIKVMATGGNLTPGSKPADAQFEQSVLEEIVRVARGHGHHVAAHCHGTSGIRNAANAGVRTIEHCSWVGVNGWGADFVQDVADHMAAADIFVSPTINSGWKRNLGRTDYEARIGGNFDRMRQAGVRLIASTDAGIPGVFHHDLPAALPLFSHFARLSAVETLRAATSQGAEAIGLGQQVGRIQKGFFADLALFDGDPISDLAALSEPTEVVARGRFILGALAPIQ